jgi:hypothetical protein
MNSITGAILILAGVVAGASRMEELGVVLGVVGFVYLSAGFWKRLWVEVPDNEQTKKPA